MIPKPDGSRVITVGIRPSWDLVCRVDGLEWDRHKTLAGQDIQPAGKALNVSKVLAYLGRNSIAAGLWGMDDYSRLLRTMKTFSPAADGSIDLQFTIVPGATRINVTIIDQRNNRDTHLRADDSLATSENLEQLDRDLQTLVKQGDICVFAGSLPEDESLTICRKIISTCITKGAGVILDTSGRPLKQIVSAGGLWLLKPNLEELAEIIGTSITDQPLAIAQAGRTLTARADIILISRGRNGAIAVTSDQAFSGSIADYPDIRPQTTVGCGDSLLAGFICGILQGMDIKDALAIGIKTGTARAWGLLEKPLCKNISGSLDKIKVEVTEITV